jgi:polar amino acid transport system substrate-binding protein
MDTHTSPKANDSRVTDLVQAGKFRVALFLPQYTKDPVTGEVRARGTVGTVMVQLAYALAARLGLEVIVLGYPTPPEVVECLKARACDVALMRPDPSRDADVDLSHPILQIDYTYLVPAGSSIRRGTDADRPEVRIAGVRNHASTLALSRLLKQAELVTAETPDATFALLRSGRADALVSVRSALLYYYSPQLPGSRVLEDYYGFNLLAMALPKGQSGRLAYINDFIEEAKASGLVQEVITRTGRRGIKVAPAGDPNTQK